MLFRSREAGAHNFFFPEAPLAGTRFGPACHVDAKVLIVEVIAIITSFAHRNSNSVRWSRREKQILWRDVLARNRAAFAAKCALPRSLSFGHSGRSPLRQLTQCCRRQKLPSNLSAIFFRNLAPELVFRRSIHFFLPIYTGTTKTTNPAFAGAKSTL